MRDLRETVANWLRLYVMDPSPSARDNYPTGSREWLESWRKDADTLIDLVAASESSHDLPAGRCEGCGEIVQADHGASEDGFGHTITESEHHPHCDGTCTECPVPVPVACGPIRTGCPHFASTGAEVVRLYRCDECGKVTGGYVDDRVTDPLGITPKGKHVVDMSGPARDVALTYGDEE